MPVSDGLPRLALALQQPFTKSPANTAEIHTAMTTIDETETSRTSGTARLSRIGRLLAEDSALRLLTRVLPMTIMAWTDSLSTPLQSLFERGRRSLATSTISPSVLRSECLTLAPLVSGISFPLWIATISVRASERVSDKIATVVLFRPLQVLQLA
jgi:sirohydrochlorin ferrochelatase